MADTHVCLFSTRTEQAWWLKKEFLRSFGPPTTKQHRTFNRTEYYGSKHLLQFIYRAILPKVDDEWCLAMSNFFGYVGRHIF